MIDPDDISFLRPGQMPEKVQEYCKKTGQSVPQTFGEISRVILESLAFKYRWTMDNLSKATGRNFKALHIVGGGSKNIMLNQFTANALNIPVITGPKEATAIGNIMVQVMALGEVKDISEIRAVVKNSFPTEDFYPQDNAVWQDAYSSFLKILT